MANCFVLCDDFLIFYKKPKNYFKKVRVGIVGIHGTLSSIVGHIRGKHVCLRPDGDMSR